MPYSIETRDGIVIQNIPDDVPQDHESLKQRVAQIRASMQSGGQPSDVAQQPETQPETTASGLVGGFTRGVTPALAGAALGASMGSVVPGVGTVLGGAAGATAGALAPVLGDVVVSLANKSFGTKYTLASDALNDILTRAGVAQPDTEAEKIAQAAGAGMGSGGASVAAGRVLSNVASPGLQSAVRAAQEKAGATGAGILQSAASPVAQRVGTIMQQQPVLQAVSGATGGAAAELAAQKGAGLPGQLAAGVVGGVAPFGVAAAAPGAIRAAKQAGQTVAAKAGPALDRATGKVTEALYGPDELAQLQQATRDARFASAGSAATPEEARRGATAAGLPVPVRLTGAQLSREPIALGAEDILRKSEVGAPLRQMTEEAHQAVAKNLDLMAEETGATAIYSSESGLPDSVRKALKRGHDVDKEKTKTLYGIAYNSPEAQAKVMNIETTPVVNVGGQTQSTLLDFLNQVPKSTDLRPVAKEFIDTAIARGILRRETSYTIDPLNPGAGTTSTKLVINRAPTVSELQSLRQEITGAANVADRRSMRDETIIKKAIDDLTKPYEGQLFTRAREQRIKQAKRWESNKIVYKILNNDRTADPLIPDNQFFQKTVLSPSGSQVEFIANLLENHAGSRGRQALNEMRAATIEHIKEVAQKGVKDSLDNKTFSQHALNQVITKLDKGGKLDTLFGSKKAQILRDLNETMQWISTNPPGTLINTSGTAQTFGRMIGDMALSQATFGIPVPVVALIKHVKTQRANNAAKAEIAKSIKAMDKYLTPGQTP